MKTFPHSVLVAAVDGLGHGPEAAAAARVAIAVMEAHPAPSPADIVLRCHHALRQTRGAVMSLASIHQDGTLVWLGIGNVKAVLLRDGEGSAERALLMQRRGVVGHFIPSLITETLRVASGDLLILATDGVQWNPYNGAIPIGAVGEMARDLLSDYAVAADDALVVVARCR